MTQVKERPEVRTIPEKETQVREAPPAPRPVRRAQWRRRAPWMALVMAFVVLVAALVLALVATDDSATTVLPTGDTGVETLDYSLLREDRPTPEWAGTLAPPVLETQPAAAYLPATADGAEGWIESTQPVNAYVPGTADTAEAWIQSAQPTESIEPVLLVSGPQ